MKKTILLLLISLGVNAQTLIKTKQIGDGLGTGSVVVTGGVGGSLTYSPVTAFISTVTAEPKLNGTGFVKSTGTVTSYDNTSYIPTTSISAFQPTVTGGYLTPSSTSTLTNKSGNISQWTNDANYATTTFIAGNYLTIANPAYTGTLTTGTLTYTDTGILAALQSSVNGYNQLIVQNTSNAANASANVIVSNNVGTATTNYGEFGMNSSAFTGTPIFSKPNAVYLTATSGDLMLGTISTNSIAIAANSASIPAIAISSLNAVSMPTLTVDSFSTSLTATTTGIQNNGSITTTTAIITPSIKGGTVSNASITITANTNATNTGTLTALRFLGGANGTVTAFNTLHNGNILVPSGRTFQGVGSGGSYVSLLDWTTGDNINIQGVQGSTDITFNPTSTSRFMIIKAAGRIGILGVASPGAALHIGAFGAAGSSNAPLKLTVAGSSLLATPEAGAMEVNTSGTLFWTPASSRYQLATCLTGSATLDFPSTLATAVSDLTLTVTGAAVNDPVILGVPNGAVTATASFFAWVSATNVVTVRFSPKGTEDPASGTFKATVNKN